MNSIDSLDIRLNNLHLRSTRPGVSPSDSVDFTTLDLDEQDLWIPFPSREQHQPTEPEELHRSAGLFNTLWPCDHGDTARRKFTLGGGLPADFSAEDLTLQQNRSLPYPQWMYTRTQNELYVYGVPSDRKGLPYFARVDATTLQVHQKVELPRILYIGGALMHRNGDVYLVHGPRLTRFIQGDLDAAVSVPLPMVNGCFTQYNGMTVAEDGNLILKGWAMTSRELGFFRRVVVALGAVLALCGVGVVALLDVSALLATLLALVPALVGVWIHHHVKVSGASWREFFRPTRSGHLLVIDPQTLRVVSQVTPPERIAYARMAMAPTGEPHAPGEAPAEWVMVPGDETMLRWRYEQGELLLDEAWRTRYRSWGDGSFAGTGPSVFGGQVYYTDNTAPFGVTSGYNLLRKPLDGGEQQRQSLSDGKPGFMFFSTVIDPLAEQVYVWDTQNNTVDARHLETLDLKWRANLCNTDCLTVASDRGHVYVSDHDHSLPPHQLMQSVGWKNDFRHIEKFFVVLDADTGGEKARISLGKSSPVMAMIVPGMNNDVFVSSREGLVRISA